MFCCRAHAPLRVFRGIFQEPSMDAAITVDLDHRIDGQQLDT